jgi:hypothetical protein
MENEIWKDIEGYEGIYQVSNLGRVRSLDYTVTKKDGTVQTYKGKVFSMTLNTTGYPYVSFRMGSSKRKSLTVHRLVAQAFIPNPNNLPEVNHRNEDKTDNRVENIEWCDRKYNMQYGTRNDRQKEKIERHSVDQLDKYGNLLNTYPSIKEAARIVGIRHPECITKCCTGDRMTAGGYRWRYSKS